MSKTIKNIFDDKLSFELFLEAEKRASKGRKYRKDIIRFEKNLEINIINLIESIKREKYYISSYKEFKIYEPKIRTIRCLPYKDRIVQQWYVNEFIKPYFYPRFINTSYACINGRGTHKCVKDLQKFMRIAKRNYSEYYIIQCDIKKFFESINKDILFNIVKNKISDVKLINFTKKLIYENSNSNGIPIGNYTSQYFGNIYLNELDYYIKHMLKIKYYVRYLDDFVLLVKEKENAKKILLNIKEFLMNNLKLELNRKTKILKNKCGINYCGYIIYETHILVRKRCKKKFLKCIKNNNMNLQKFNSFISHVKHANSYNLINKYYNLYLKNK